MVGQGVKLGRNEGGGMVVGWAEKDKGKEERNADLA